MAVIAFSFFQPSSTFSRKVSEMNKLLSQTARALPAVLVFAAATLSTGAHADEAGKKALAVKLAQLQQKTTGAELANQLTGNMAQQLIAKWGPQVQSRVPASQQKAVNDKLSAELNKFGETTHGTIQAQTDKTAQDALVPVFMSKLSESEIKTVVTYLQNPASAKFTALGGDAAKAWVSKIAEGTQTTVQGNMQNFDAAAEKIVSAAAGSASAPASSAPSTAPTAPADPASGAGDADSK
jgi:hypothetical protein